MVAFAAVFANPPAAQPRHEQGEVDVDVDDGVHFGECIQLLRLEEVARKAVQKVAALAVRLREPAFDDLTGDFVGNELPLVRIGLGEQADLGAALDVVAEDVTRGDVRQPEFIGDARSLCAFSGAGGAQQDDVHKALLSYSLRARPLRRGRMGLYDYFRLSDLNTRFLKIFCAWQNDTFA